MTDRKEVEFHDRPTETGVRINNVLTGLLLGAALWVGNSVEDLKEAVVILATQQEHLSLIHISEPTRPTT